MEQDSVRVSEQACSTVSLLNGSPPGQAVQRPHSERDQRRFQSRLSGRAKQAER